MRQFDWSVGHPTYIEDFFLALWQRLRRVLCPSMCIIAQTQL